MKNVKFVKIWNLVPIKSHVPRCDYFKPVEIRRNFVSGQKVTAQAFQYPHSIRILSISFVWSMSGSEFPSSIFFLIWLRLIHKLRSSHRNKTQILTSAPDLFCQTCQSSTIHNLRKSRLYDTKVSGKVEKQLNSTFTHQASWYGKSPWKRPEIKLN